GRELAHHAERIEIARTGGAPEVGAPPDIGNAAPQRQPRVLAARIPAADAKTVGIIERHFDAQQAAGFGIPPDRVLVEPTANAHAFGPMDQRAVCLAFEAAGLNPP